MSKKFISPFLKTSWLILGGAILLWTIFWYIKMITINTLGVLALAALFASGIYLLAIYLGLTIIFLLIKWLIKKIKHERKN